MYWASVRRKECSLEGKNITIGGAKLIVLIVHKIFAKKLEKAVDKRGPALYTYKVGCVSNSDKES